MSQQTDDKAGNLPNPAEMAKTYAEVAYSAFRSGHALNNQLLRALLAQPDAYEIVSFEHEREAPLGFAQLAPAW